MYTQIAVVLSILTYVIVPKTYANPVMTRQKLLEQTRTEHHCTNLVYFNNAYYAIDEQRNLTGTPADLSIHWKTDNLYFTLISAQMKMSLHVLRSSGELETIKVPGLGQSTAVDNLNDIVYLATDNGVYKFKEDGSSVELYTALGEDVMYIGVTSDGATLYIATWPQNKVHMITGDGQRQESFPYIPNGHGLTVDTRNNVYFVATKTSYILKNGDTVPIKIKGLPSDKMTGVFVTRQDEVYAMDENSKLYSVDPENASATLLGSFNVEGVNTFGMDANDNVWIGLKDIMMKFKVFEENPCPSNKAFSTPSKRHVKKKFRYSTTTPPNSDYEVTYADDEYASEQK